MEPEAAVNSGWYGVLGATAPDEPASAPAPAVAVAAAAASDDASVAPPPPPANCVCIDECSDDGQCTIAAFGMPAGHTEPGDCLLRDDCAAMVSGFPECSLLHHGTQTVTTYCTSTFDYVAPPPPPEAAMAASSEFEGFGLAGSTVNRLGQAGMPVWEIYAASCGPAGNGHSFCQV